MPRYFFNINDGRKIITDPEGTEFRDDDSARVHAYQVVRELTRNREQRTSSWQLAVFRADGTRCFGLLFASVDDSILQLPPEVRSTVETAWRNAASLQEAINEVRTTLYQVKGTMARSQGKPYLATLHGVQL